MARRKNKSCGFRNGSSNVQKFRREVRSYGSASLASLYGCHVCAEAEADGAEEVSAGADAGAAVPLQPGVCRLRQDSVSGAYPEGGVVAGGVLQGGGRVRDADGVDPGRRAAAAPADAGDCGGSGRAKEVRVYVHERAAS